MLSFVNVVASRRVWMAIVAGKFSPVVISVLPVRDCSKMIRIHAPAIAAFVINFQILWNVSFEYLKGYAMRLYASCAKSEFSITLFGQAGRPLPASSVWVKFKLFYEAIKNWSVGWHSSTNKNARISEVDPAAFEDHCIQDAGKLMNLIGGRSITISKNPIAT